MQKENKGQRLGGRFRESESNLNLDTNPKRIQTKSLSNPMQFYSKQLSPIPLNND